MNITETFDQIQAQTEIDVARVHRVSAIFSQELQELDAAWWAITSEMDALVDRFEDASHARWLELQAKRTANVTKATELSKLQVRILQAL